MPAMSPEKGIADYHYWYEDPKLGFSLLSRSADGAEADYLLELDGATTPPPELPMIIERT